MVDAPLTTYGVARFTWAQARGLKIHRETILVQSSTRPGSTRSCCTCALNNETVLKSCSSPFAKIESSIICTISMATFTK